jgi:hypothetical protein
MSRYQRDEKVQFLSAKGMRRRFNVSRSGGREGSISFYRWNEKKVQFLAIRGGGGGLGRFKLSPPGGMRRRFSFSPSGG